MRSTSSDRFDFVSPASTSLDELVKLRGAAQALQRQIRKKSAAPLSGGSVSRRLGRGLDFAEVREYQPGDDVRMIDWKVTARSGKAHTKLFVEERERPVLLMVDFRASMRFGTRGMYKSVLAARLAALLGWCAVASHDRVGGFVFTDDWHSEIRPQAGRRGLMGLFRAIHQSQLRVPTVGEDQLSKSLSRLRHGVHAGSTVVILSDFDGFDESAKSSLGSVLQTLDIVAVHICDPLDHSLPKPGRYPMLARNDAEKKRFTLNVGSNAEQTRYRKKFQTQQSLLRELFAHNRHFYTTVSTDTSLLDSASNVLSRTQQGALESVQAS
ncbi:MAG: DUF58 domain-containing protein [Granulosicoccus sp.]